MAKKENIIKAAGHYLCAENGEDLYNEYLRLLQASEDGHDDELASDFADVWEPLSMTMTVAKMIQVIEDDAADTTPSEEFFSDINWGMLRTQKKSLLAAIEHAESTGNKDYTEDLVGILHLVDSIQDHAVDKLGMPEMEIFEFEDEENRNEPSIRPSMKKVYLCGNCGSDRVEMKGWIKPNDGSAAEFESISDDEDDNYCNDCGEHCSIVIQEIPAYKEVVGYQVVSIDGDDIHPDMEGSFCLYSLKQAEEMLTDHSKWKLLTLWTDDVEEPTLMFEGDPRG